jgi:2-oxoglutarate ferredoxin oxidoreductase subunit beta
VWPDKVVFSYQGDGDLAAIGTCETIHTCNRGENITMIFVNNGIYGMTGGQMAPTTLVGMKTATTPYGRMPQWPDGTPNNGFPLQITQLIAQLPGTRYVTRQAVFSAAAVRNAKKAIKKAFQNQIENKNGVNFVEIVSNCNSNWKMSAVDANKWLQDNMLPVYPLGDLKDNFELIKK